MVSIEFRGMEGEGLKGTRDLRLLWGLAAGLPQAGRKEAATSSFGWVRAVVGAHQTRRGQAAAVLGGLTMTVWLVAGIFLVACFAALVLVLVVIAIGHPGDGRPPGGG